MKKLRWLIILLILAVAIPAGAWLNPAMVSGTLGSSNYYAELAATIAAGEATGLKTSADSADDPYGANLQPGADMSGTAGTTSGAGTANGDIATGWNVEAGVGGTVTASKTANDYQTIFSAVSFCKFATAGISITTGEIRLAECYVSGIVLTPQWRVSRDGGATIQFAENLSAGYNRKVFTATDTLTGAVNFAFGASEGCTIHWTSLRKLSGSNAILTELDRTLRANGTELHTDANAASDPNGNEADATTGWVAYATATLESQGVVKSVGSYALHYASVNNNDTCYYDLDSKFSVGDRVQLSTTIRSDGTGAGTGQVALKTAANTAITINAVTIKTYVKADVAFVPLVYEFTYSSNTRYVGFREGNTEGDGGVYWDNVSIQLMQPTVTTLKRVASVETVLDTSYVDYSAAAELITIKEGEDVTVIYDDVVQTRETVSDASVIYNKLHGKFGDNVAEATIIRFGVGALISTGTCVINTVYKVSATELNHYGTGVLAGYVFISAGTETNDANNQVWAVNTP